MMTVGKWKRASRPPFSLEPNRPLRVGRRNQKVDLPGTEHVNVKCWLVPQEVRVFSSEGLGDSCCPVNSPHVSRSVAVGDRATRIGRSQKMRQFVNRAKDFLKSEDGPTATEYAVMLSLIIIVAIGTITTLGTTVKGVFANVTTELAKVPGGT